MPKKRLKAGIIGLGNMGYRHFEAYEKAKDFIEIVAICDSNSEILNKISDSKKIKKYFDWNKLIEKEPLDIISVVTYGPSHHKIVIEAARNGIKNIVCEKPISTSLEKAIEMVNVCKKENINLAINHSRRFSPTHKNLIDIIEKGVIGKLCNIYCSLGGGSLGCVGVHIFDLFCMLTKSYPEWCVGSIDETNKVNNRGDNFYDPGGYGIFKFNNGVRCFLEMSEDLGIPFKIEITGSLGRITLDESMRKIDIFTRKEDDKNKPLSNYGLPLIPYSADFQLPFDMVSLTYNLIEELCLTNKTSCTGQFGVNSLEMLIALYKSHRSDNSKIKFPLKNKDLTIDLPIT